MELLQTFILTGLVYLFVPLIVYFFRGKHAIGKHAAWAVPALWAVVVYTILLIVYVQLNVEGIPNMTAAAVWSVVGWRILASKVTMPPLAYVHKACKEEDSSTHD